MLANTLEAFLKTINPNDITELFIWFILIIFVLALILSITNKVKGFVQHSATLMTSFGILGTFVGIVIGLLYFDTTDINASIPELLGGLKTAFITSVVGLFLAITFNIINTIFISPLRVKSQTVSIESVGPKDIYQTLEGSRKTLQELKSGVAGNEEGSLVGQLKLLRLDLADSSKQYQTLQSIESHLNKLNESMSGTEEGSMIGQLKLMRTEGKDRSTLFEQKLFHELANFSEMMSKSATEQIIEALKNVIIDFNKNLTEQFGDNFKALDKSVQKLVVWQQQYKEQVDVMGEQYSQSVSSLVETKIAVAGIWKECENIPMAMDRLKEVLEVNQHQIAELQRHLESFVKMRDAAVEAVPTIQAQLDSVGEHLINSSTQLQERLRSVSDDLLTGSNEMKVSLTEGAEHFRNSVTQTQQSFSEMSTKVTESTESIGETLGVAVEDFTSSISRTVSDLAKVGENLSNDMDSVTKEFDSMRVNTVTALQSHAENITAELSKTLQQAHQVFNQNLESASKNAGTTMNSQLEQLEMSTAREIEQAMQSMGNSLVQITSKFVTDYQAMVQAMERVVNHSNKI